VASSCFWVCFFESGGAGQKERRKKKKSEFFSPFLVSLLKKIFTAARGEIALCSSYQQAHPERVHVHAVVVFLVVELRSHKLRRPQDRLRRRARPKQRREAQVANLDDALAAVDKDVVAFQVPVDDRRRVPVEVHEPAEDLPGPPLEHLDVDRALVLLAVLPQRAAREQLGDEVDRRRAAAAPAPASTAGAVVEPAVMKGHDVAVLELLQHADLGEQPVALGRAARGLADQLGDADLVPGNLGALFLVEGLVDGLEGAAAEDLVELFLFGRF